MSLTRIRKALDEYEASISTCAYDRRGAVLCRLVRETVNGIAGLAEDLTDENSTDVAGCSEFLTDAILAMFLEAEAKAEDRRAGRAA